MTSNFDSVLTKITALLNLADHENTPPAEAANARAKAEAMMRKYRVEEQELADSAPELGLVPVTRDVTLCPMSTPYRQAYYSMMYWVAEHAGVRLSYRLGYDAETRLYSAKLVGYESDIRYAELLYTSARTVFGARLEPAVDREFSDEDNVYRLRSAGIERGRIAEMLWGVRGSKSANIKVTRLYHLACVARGEDAAVSGRQINAKTFRKEYSEQFVSTLYTRLAAARNAADSPAGAVVLVSRKDKVDEAFYELHPDLRPKPVQDTDEPKRKPRKRSEREQRAALRRMYEREANPAVQAGRVAGRSAASEVDLTGTKRTQRLEDESGWVDRTFREMTS